MIKPGELPGRPTLPNLTNIGVTIVSQYINEQIDEGAICASCHVNILYKVNGYDDYADHCRYCNGCGGKQKFDGLIDEQSESAGEV